MRRLSSLTLCVVTGREQIHCLTQLVNVNERSYNDEGPQNIPQPVASGSKAVRNAAPSEFAANSGRYPVEPDKIGDAERDRPHKEEEQTVVHRLLSVVAAGDQIDVRGNAGIENDGIDPKRHNAQQDQLEQSSVCFQVCGRRRRRILRRSVKLRIWLLLHIIPSSI